MEDSLKGKIRQMMHEDSETLVRSLEREDGVLELKMGLDSGKFDVHNAISEDDDLKQELEDLIRKFYPEKKEFTEEDVDDVFDEDEYKAQSSAVRRSSVVEEVIPPENFSHVVGEIYRSSFPRPENFAFLQKRIKLKSILVLIPEEYPQENREFMEDAGIKLFQVGMSGNKEPFVNIPSDILTRALEVAINPANHPILIHCNRGKHRTGCLVGCIRRLQNWSLTMIFDEYRRFAFPKARALDQQFIEMYDDHVIKKNAHENNWLPIKW
ncbi:LAFE_0E10704g1_1 [Lachancea fermentati]|uniref:diphosphoinositol-polyphosphate diphosphatase n=1 Tax=Lachancea fermentati TaxID=4955 RepID=A0A1G4MDE2_LACFM|nr:LAFE_0E10704g1_1 [Lachancea fermentati]